MFFGLCSSAGVQLQVAPRYAAGNEAEQPETPSPHRKVDLIRLKPQPSITGEAILSTKILSLNVEDELYLFVNDSTYSHTFDLALFGCSVSAINCYSFEPSTMTPNANIVSILRGYVSRYHSASVVSEASFANQNFDRGGSQNYSTACKSLSLLLSGYLSNPDAGRSHHVNNNVKIMSIGAGLNSIVHILTIVVSPM